MTKAMLAEALGEKPEGVNKSLTKMHKEERLVRMASTFDQSGSTTHYRDQDTGQHRRRCRVLMTFISGQNLYETHQ